MQSIKSIEDANLKENDIIKHYCKKCNKTTLYKIIVINENITGKCAKCKSYVTLKMNENYIPEEQPQNIPKCPTCGSTNIEKISGTAKVAGAVAFGLFSKTARSQFKCKNCGYKW